MVEVLHKAAAPDNDPAKVRGQLTEYGLVPEEYGGDTMFVNVSAHTGQGIEQLLEYVRDQETPPKTGSAASPGARPRVA